MKILSIVGTRPNFIKVAALYEKFKQSKNIEPILIHTGQHYDYNMSNIFFKDLNIPKPDINLEICGGSHTFQVANIMLKLEPFLSELSPDIIVVVGDVNSTLAAALVAVREGIPLVHIEAGLRSGDRSMPEEINRILVDQLADFLFVTEESGLKNLKREGIPEDKIFFVGNVMVDSLLNNIKKINNSKILKALRLKVKDYVVVTLHRPSNTDDKSVLHDLLVALKEINKSKKIIFPVHPRTRSRINEFGLFNIVKNKKNFILTDPLGYLDFLCIMKHAYVVITDSGGIQEETTILGVPCLTIRNNTERPVTLQQGTNMLVSNCGRNLIDAFFSLSTLKNSNQNPPPLWDGCATLRIINILEKEFQKRISLKNSQSNSVQ